VRVGRTLACDGFWNQVCESGEHKTIHRTFKKRAQRARHKFEFAIFAGYLSLSTKHYSKVSLSFAKIYMGLRFWSYRHPSAVVNTVPRGASAGILASFVENGALSVSLYCLHDLCLTRSFKWLRYNTSQRISRLLDTSATGICPISPATRTHTHTTRRALSHLINTPPVNRVFVLVHRRRLLRHERPSQHGL
jgi:hypothetical protein